MGGCVPAPPQPLPPPSPLGWSPSSPRVSQVALPLFPPLAQTDACSARAAVSAPIPSPLRCSRERERSNGGEGPNRRGELSLCGRKEGRRARLGGGACEGCGGGAGGDPATSRPCAYVWLVRFCVPFFLLFPSCSSCAPNEQSKWQRRVRVCRSIEGTFSCPPPPPPTHTHTSCVGVSDRRRWLYGSSPCRRVAWPAVTLPPGFSQDLHNAHDDFSATSLSALYRDRAYSKQRNRQTPLPPTPTVCSPPHPPR